MGMRQYFSYTKCERCGHKHDLMAHSCPVCGERNAKRPADSKHFDHDAQFGFLKELLLWLVGWAGFNLLGLIVSLIAQFGFRASWTSAHPDATAEALKAALTEYIHGNSYAMIANGVSYAILFLLLVFAIVGRDYRELLRPWRNWRTYAAGAVTFAALMVVSVAWGSLSQMIANANHLNIDVNRNQSTLNSMIPTYPILCLILFGIIGPICEELTYRAGLFSFLKRLSPWVAFVGVPLIFGFIHFDWDGVLFGASSFDSMNEYRAYCANECLNIVDYVLAGLVLSLSYHFFGLGASTFAHVLNNLYAVIASLMLANLDPATSSSSLLSIAHWLAL